MTHNDKVPTPVLPQSPSSLANHSPPIPDFYYEVEQGHSIRDYIGILVRRKWWIIGTLLTIFLMVALLTFTSTPLYRSSATLEINRDNSMANVSATPGMGFYQGFVFEEKFLQTQIEILQSRSVALRVINSLNLGEHPDFAAIKNAQNISASQIEDMMVKLFLAKLKIEPMKNTYLVQVSYQSPDKEIVKKVLDVIDNEFVYLLIQRRNESFSLVKKWLQEQLDNMAEKVHEAQGKLYKFGQKTDIYTTLEEKDSRSSAPGGNVVFQKFIDLSALLTKAQAEKIAKKGQFQQINDKGPDAPLIVNHPLIATLREQLVVQQSKVSGMDQIYLSDHPEMQAEKARLAEIKSRLNAEVTRLKESIKADYEAADRTEKLLQESFAAQKEQMAKLQENLSNYEILKRDAQTNEQLYLALLARVKEANIASTMISSNVSVIDPAPLPSIPYKPKKVQNLALAIFFGIILGIALALIVESLDDSVKSTEYLEKTAKLPVLGTLPKISNGRNLTNAPYQRFPFSLRQLFSWFRPGKQAITAAADLDLIVFKHPQIPLTEALRQMQASILLSMSGRPPIAIMITSPNPSEGKTMVANNLALGFALNNRSTVIMDCDLRKPRIHKIYDQNPQPGLTNYLTGTSSLEEIQRPTPIPNLTVIPAGPVSPNPGNLLSSEIFRDLLTLLRQQYNHVIVDTPPILGFSDARMVSVLVDGTILVIKSDFTHKSAAKLAQQLLSQIHAPIMGAVLNWVDTSKYNYGGYYHLSYAKYYSKYYNEIK